MSHIKLVTSGKGGAGKSTVCVYTAAALVRQGRSVLLLEMDAGLRGLDIMMGVSDRTVYDIGDVLESRVEPARAIVECAFRPGLHLMPAPVRHDFCPRAEDLQRLCRGLNGYYDYLILDSPAGFGIGFEVSLSVADSAVVVATPDPVTVRDASAVARLLYGGGVDDVKLIINRVPPRPRMLLVPDLDAVIDAVGAQLIGAVPDDRYVVAASARGVALPTESPAHTEFRRIASRMQGTYVPLWIH